MPKTPTSARQTTSRRHNPLADEYEPNPDNRKTGRPTKRRKSLRDGENEQDAFIDPKTSSKILRIGQDLQEADQAELAQARAVPVENPAFLFGSRFPDQPDDDGLNGTEGLDEDDDEAWGDEEEEVEEIEVDPSDLEMFNRFNPPTFDDPILRLGEEEKSEEQQGTNLADLILEKIAEHEAMEGGQREILGGGPPEDAVELPAKVVEVFSKIGQILSRYKSGPIPKPLKMLPTLPQWEILLSITQPDQWTPHAIQATTRVFISGKADVAQEFLASVVLPAFRDSVHETTKVPVQLYAALKKSMYKPAAFFKGFLFPLMASGTATLREAHIVSSVIARVSIPVLHSAAALHRLCDISASQMMRRPESAGAVNMCIRVLLEKKYALPYKVVDSLVFHFLRFRNASADTVMAGTGANAQPIAGNARLPVIWHQCLLAFVQRYKNDITEDQREALLDLLLERGHGTIGPEVRRELIAGRGRGVAPNEGAAGGLGDGGDDTMVLDA